jgi:hypothetical protein
MRTILDILHYAYFMYILNCTERYYAQKSHHTVSYYTHCPAHTSRSIRCILRCAYNTRHTILNISYYVCYTVHTFPYRDIATVHIMLYILCILYIYIIVTTSLIHTVHITCCTSCNLVICILYCTY